MPMIVIPHGGPIGVRDTPLFNREAQFFAHHGFAVLQVNFRGSSGYGEDFLMEGYRQWGRGMIDDITLATRFMIQNGVADESRICIYGASYGGYASLISVVREPELYQCAVGYAGIYNLTELGKSDIPFQPGGENYIEVSVGTEESELVEQSPVNHAEKIKVPVFLIHGKQDERAPVSQARDMGKALSNANVEHELWIESGERHGFYAEDNKIRLFDRVLEFVETHTSIQ